MCRPMPQRLFIFRVSNSIDSLEHRCNLACVSLFYCYYNCKITGLIAVNHVFLCSTRLSCQSHSYVVDWPVDRTLHDKQNSLSGRTIRMWNSPRAAVAIFWFLRDGEGIKYRNIIIVITNLTFYSTKLKIIMLIYITTDFARAK